MLILCSHARRGVLDPNPKTLNPNPRAPTWRRAPILQISSPLVGEIDDTFLPQGFQVAVVAVPNSLESHGTENETTNLHYVWNLSFLEFDILEFELLESDPLEFECWNSSFLEFGSSHQR